MDMADDIFAVLVVADDFEWATFPDGKFADAVDGGGALDLDCGKDQVARFVEFERSGGVGAMG